MPNIVYGNRVTKLILKHMRHLYPVMCLAKGTHAVSTSLPNEIPLDLIF